MSSQSSESHPEENQSREQYWFEDDTFRWIGELISETERVGAIFMPSLLQFPNVWVFDADERFARFDRFTLLDVTRTEPDLDKFEMILLDPPFALSARHLAPLLAPARRVPLLISATDWCVARAGWGELFSRYGISQVTNFFPRYRSIANGYCETGVKRHGRTNISFYSNISFAPPRQPVILQRDDAWITFDAYDFLERERSDEMPGDEPAIRPSSDNSLAEVKAQELKRQWQTIQRTRRVSWRQKFLRLLGF